jgi:hypothetical protein
MVIELLAGGGLTALGWALGRLPSPRRRRRGPKPVEAICGCGHHHSFHDPKTGECHETEYEGTWGGTPHYTRCTCRHYSGPEPVPAMFAPELAAGDGQ